MIDNIDKMEMNQEIIETDEEWQKRQRIKILQIERDRRLNSLTHTLPSGYIIQCRLIDEQNMRNAIERMQRLNTNKHPWRMADNSAGTVTVADLEETLISGQDQAAEVWQWFMIEAAKL